MNYIYAAVIFKLLACLYFFFLFTDEEKCRFDKPHKHCAFDTNNTALVLLLMTLALHVTSFCLPLVVVDSTRDEGPFKRVLLSLPWHSLAQFAGNEIMGVFLKDGGHPSLSCELSVTGETFITSGDCTWFKVIWE